MSIARREWVQIHSHVPGYERIHRGGCSEQELHRAALAGEEDLPPEFGCTSEASGRLYARMGFTTVVEPAVAPSYATHAHLELDDIPIIDKAMLAVLGNEAPMLAKVHQHESAPVLCRIYDILT